MLNWALDQDDDMWIWWPADWNCY